MPNQENDLEEKKIKIIEKIYNKYTEIMDRLKNERKKMVLSFFKKNEEEKIKKIKENISNI